MTDTINETINRHLNEADEIDKLEAIVHKHMKAMVKDINRKTDLSSYEGHDGWEEVQMALRDNIEGYLNDLGV